MSDIWESNRFRYNTARFGLASAQARWHMGRNQKDVCLIPYWSPPLLQGVICLWADTRKWDWWDRGAWLIYAHMMRDVQGKLTARNSFEVSPSLSCEETWTRRVLCQYATSETIGSMRIINVGMVLKHFGVTDSCPDCLVGLKIGAAQRQLQLKKRQTHNFFALRSPQWKKKDNTLWHKMHPYVQGRG